MSQETLHEVFRQYRTAEEKYTYFLLAAAGAGIALAVNRTGNSVISLSQIPLAVAVLSWALSFFFGCRFVLFTTSSLYANFHLLQAQRGEHPEYSRSPQYQEIAVAGIREAIESNSRKAVRRASWQFILLLLGAVMYVTWHMIEMSLRH